MATTTTWESLIERIVNNLWPGRFPLKITATGGSGTTFVASTAAYSSASANAYDAVYIFILDTTDDLAPKGEFGQVTSAGFTAASGTWALGSTLTAIASGDVGLFLYGLHPNELLDAANDIQRTLYLPRYTIMSPITDGDMEATGTTSWADVGTCTQTKSTTASEVLTGTQSLKLVITAGITNGVTSDPLPVQDSENILVSVAFKTATTLGSLSVQLYDVTNAAAIQTVTPTNTRLPAWAECRFEKAVPSGCQQIAIRLLNSSATDEATVYVDWVAAYRTEESTYNLPTAVLDATDAAIMFLPLGFSTDDSYVYNASLNFEAWPSEPLRDLRALNSQRIVVGRPIQYPLFLKYRTTGSVMSALTSTTEAPVEMILHGALSICLNKLADRTGDMATKADLVRRAVAAFAVYQHLLDAAGLLRPRVVSSRRERVNVPW